MFGSRVRIIACHDSTISRYTFQLLLLTFVGLARYYHI
nr:MAG TPA: hypothetical protein [Caudoviricetes sp.]